MKYDIGALANYHETINRHSVNVYTYDWSELVFTVYGDTPKEAKRLARAIVQRMET